MYGRKALLLGNTPDEQEAGHCPIVWPNSYPGRVRQYTEGSQFPKNHVCLLCERDMRAVVLDSQLDPGFESSSLFEHYQVRNRMKQNKAALGIAFLNKLVYKESGNCLFVSQERTALSDRLHVLCGSRALH